MINKTDAVVYTTANRKTLAKVALYIQGTGTHLRSMSEMVRLVLETFETWIDKKGTQDVTSTHEATEILQNMFRASLNPGNRRSKQLLENLQQDEPEVDFTTIDSNGVAEPEIDPKTAQAYYKYAGIEPPKVTRSPEEQATLEESVRKAQELMISSQKTEQLTELQIKRNKAVAEATIAQMDKYHNLAKEAKSQKLRESYELMKHKVAKYSQLASEGDNEALRILVDEL